MCSVSHPFAQLDGFLLSKFLSQIIDSNCPKTLRVKPYLVHNIFYDVFLNFIFSNDAFLFLFLELFKIGNMLQHARNDRTEVISHVFIFCVAVLETKISLQKSLSASLRLKLQNMRDRWRTKCVMSSTKMARALYSLSL